MPHITLKSIANNAEIDVIWEKWQTEMLEPLREKLNTIPRNEVGGVGDPARGKSPIGAEPTRKQDHAAWWEARIARQKEIDASIAAKAEFEYLYDKPYEDKKKVRVAGPVHGRKLSPHRMLGVDENDALIDPLKENEGRLRSRRNRSAQSFAQMILENLKTAGVQQAHKEDKIDVHGRSSPGRAILVCAEGRYCRRRRGVGTEKRAAIFIGPEFGTVTRAGSGRRPPARRRTPTSTC